MSDSSRLDWLKGAFDSAPVGMCFAGPDFKFVEVNAAFCEMLGYNREELLTKTIFEITHPDDVARSVEKLQKVSSGKSGTFKVEKRYLAKSGEVVWGYTTVSVAERDREGKVALTFAVIQDTTTRKRLETALKESEAQYRSLAEAAHDMIFVLDRLGTITYANSFAAAQFGLPPEEMIGRKRADFFGPSAEAQDISLRQVFEKGEPLYRETRMPFGDKMLWLSTWLVPLMKGVEVTGILGVSRDISAQKETELSLMKLNRTLKESEESYHGLFDSVSEAVYIQDADGKFLEVNPGAAKMYGYPRGWFVGKSPLDVAAPGKNDLPKIKEAVERAFAGEPQEFEFWGVRSNGEVFPKDVRLYKGTYFGKEVVMALATDITARKEQERQRDEFVMIASHELRAPMTAIKWLISMILEGAYGPINDKIRENLSGVTASTDRLIHLVNDVISVGRIEGGHLRLPLTSFDIKEAIENAVATFGPEIKQKGMTFDLAGVGSAKVYANQDKTVQILSNLIDNAIKFSDKGTVKIAVEVEAKSVRIVVADDGNGISDSFKTRLFGKFAQGVGSKDGGKSPGTGLGLYISRQLAQMMGGDIVLVGSEVGKGSVFAISLPIGG